MSFPRNSDPPNSAGTASPTPTPSPGPGPAQPQGSGRPPWRPSTSASPASEPVQPQEHPEHKASQGSPIDHIKAQALEAQIIEVLRTCYDPEIPVDIYQLGLIYNVDVDAAGAVRIQMTLTSPACPVAGSLPPEVESRVNAVDGVTNAKVELVWDPPWTPERMSEAAKLQLNM